MSQSSDPYAEGSNMPRRSLHLSPKVDSKPGAVEDFAYEIEDDEEADRYPLLEGVDEEKDVSRRASLGAVAPHMESPAPISPYVIIPVWIMLSGGIILFNKHVFSGLNFPYPVFMTAYHMVVATIGTRVLDRLPFERFQSKPTAITRATYCRTILPLSILYSASLIFSNMAIVHLSVSFVQMLKAFTPILFLVIQMVTGLQKYNHLLLGIVLMTAAGCMIAAAGELRFSVFGFACQALAVVTEATRLVLLQVMLKDFKMDPLSSIKMFAPVCVLIIGTCLPFREGFTPLQNFHNIGYLVLIANGLVAFSLNIASFLLIGSAGSLVSTLSGVIKDVLLIILSFASGTPITFVQTIGYAISLTGLVVFRYTGGDPTSPHGQKLVKLFNDAAAIPRSALGRIAGTRSMLLAASMLIILVTTSVLYLDHPLTALLVAPKSP